MALTPTNQQRYKEKRQENESRAAREGERSRSAWIQRGMAQVTLQLLEGLERGLIFRKLATPVTIGREDENSVRLNDERVSRFHAKIQEDGGQLILTDLESTNGTRINGHPIQMRVLQIGDQIAIGRCLLVYGSPEEIRSRMAELLAEGKDSSESTHEEASPHNGTRFGVDPYDDGTSYGGAGQHGPVERESDDLSVDLFPNGAPEPPRGLRPLQRAQVSDVLGYCHEQIRRILHAGVEENGDNPVMRVSWQDWQRLLQLEMELAISIKKVADPDS
jgi:pSer/pThr/pTyr-binding forkhead associated (FHA) protein